MCRGFCRAALREEPGLGLPSVTRQAYRPCSGTGSVCLSASSLCFGKPDFWPVLRRGFSQKAVDVGTAPSSQGKVIFQCNSIPQQCETGGFQLCFSFLLLCLLKTYLIAWLGLLVSPLCHLCPRAQRGLACSPCSAHFLWGSSARAPEHQSDPFQSVRERSAIPAACFPL